MFKTLIKFPSYEISEEGVLRNVNTKKVKYSRINKQGYVQTLFRKDNKFYGMKIHRLVAEYFLPPPSEELIEECSKVHPFVVCVNHIDGDKTNNHVSNLEWCSMKGNSDHAYANGLVPFMKGSKNGRAKLTEDIVHSICKDFENGMRISEAIDKYSLSRSQATKIRSGHAWKHVWSQYNIKVNRRK